METLRIDKWLWAARFFKTRALAADACDLGRVDCNGNRAKPARDIRPGDRLRITNEGGVFEIDVVALSAARGPAATAQALYRELPVSRAAREALAAERKQMLAAGGLTESRPSKRDRRDLAKLRGRIHRF